MNPMKENHTYEPEDLEGLLLRKSFAELYPEERDFVLRHLDSEAEYESIRGTLRAILEDGAGPGHVEPKPEIRERVLERFRGQRRSGVIIRIWENFSALPEWSRLALPLAVAAGLALLLWLGPLSGEQGGTARLADNYRPSQNAKETARGALPGQEEALGNEEVQPQDATTEKVSDFYPDESVNEALDAPAEDMDIAKKEADDNAMQNVAMAESETEVTKSVAAVPASTQLSAGSYMNDAAVYESDSFARKEQGPATTAPKVSAYNVALSGLYTAW